MITSGGWAEMESKISCFEEKAKVQVSFDNDALAPPLLALMHRPSSLGQSIPTLYLDEKIHHKY